MNVLLANFFDLIDPRVHKSNPFRVGLRCSLLIVSVLLMGGCTSMQKVSAERAPWAEAIHPGDSLIVYVVTGEIMPITVSEVSPSSLKGYSEGKSFEWEWNELVKVEREQVDVLATAGATVGVVVLVPVVVTLCLLGGCGS